MLKMASQIDKIVNAYKTLSKIPGVSGGKLNSAGNRITAKWTVRNLDKGKSTKYTTNYTLDENLRVTAQSDFGADVSNELLSAISPTETYKAIIREEKNGKDTKKQYLEVWKQSTLAHCIDLTALDLHGDVYADSEFGSLDWMQDETAIVYVAERKPPKNEPYIKRKGEEKPKSDGSGDAPKKGEEFVYRQDWGEQLVGKFSSVIVMCRLPDESVSLLDHLPPGCCPGQVRFSRDQSERACIVGVAWETEPRRLGLIFCTNRPSFVFSLSLDGVMTKLSAVGLSVRSVRVRGACGSLVWLQRRAAGPHHACHQLAYYGPLTTYEVSPVIDIVQTEVAIENGAFRGVYSQALPARCFSRDGRLVFSTPQQNEIRAYVADLSIPSERIVDISIRGSPGSTTVLDVQNDVILASFSNLTTPGQLYVGRLPPKGSEADIEWVRVSETVAPPPPVAAACVQYLQLAHADSTADVKSFSAIYFAPPLEAGKKCPLIVWPHGGPHANFVNSFAMETAFFNMLGFAALLINYRGSTGAGQQNVEYLLTRAGSADVEDCKLATDVALRTLNVDGRRVVLFGGSHGGFLVTHLSGQHPGTYRAVVARNPVTDIATMYNYTDINDWCNYRGSTGCGDANVRSLIRHVGDYDVDDCRLALTTLLERDVVSHVLLFGGSYGGLVVGHLAARCPVEFKAMVMKNPLIDLATKGHYADNSDGCAVEAGFEFTEKGAVQEDQLVAMRRCSPLAHVHRVRAPTALMLGAADRRVPHHQGLDYARRLKANGVETRVYMYEDNHSLSTQPAEMDNLINSAHWFLTHMEE